MRFPLLLFVVLALQIAGAHRLGLAAGPGISAAVQAIYQRTQTAESEADFDEIIEACRRAIETPAAAGDTAYASQLLSWALNRRGERRYDEADDEDSFRRARADFEESVQWDATRWRALQNLAIDAEHRGQTDEAMRLIERVLDLNPGCISAYYNRGELFYSLGNYTAAVADYSQALQLDPRDASSLNGRGHARFRSGDYGRAVDDFAAAVAAQPNDAELRIDLADALQATGRWGDAASEYRAATRSPTAGGLARLRLAWLLATCPADAVRDPGEARRWAAAVPQDESLAVELAAVLAAEAGEFDRAVRLQRQALEMAAEQQDAAAAARLELYQRRQLFRLQPLVGDAPGPASSGDATRRMSQAAGALESMRRR